MLDQLHTVLSFALVVAGVWALIERNADKKRLAEETARGD